MPDQFARNAIKTWFPFLVPVVRKSLALLDKTTRAARSRVRRDPNDFLKSCSGVIHVGANTGQERELYAAHGLKVVWIEPIPDVYHQLVDNIARYADQTAIEALITDRDGEACTLHVSNNDGASSSILDLHQHRDIWPEVHYVKDIELRSRRLTTALSAAGLDPDAYDALIIDMQGTELLVLRGAAEILPRLQYIKTEAADFESYRGCTTVDEIQDYLGRYGFRLVRKDAFAQRRSGGSYFEVLFQRKA